MTKATDAFEWLQKALEETDPACAGDSRFIADGVRAEDLAPICAACPVFTLCQQYARTARPPAGVWAGKRWTTKGATN